MSGWSTTPSNFLTRTVVPLLLVVVTPPAAMLMWHTMANLNGSVTALGQEIWQKGFFDEISEVWLSRFFGSVMAWKMIGIFAVAQALMLWFLPGKKYYGTITPKGNQPEYKDNGLLSYILTFMVFLFCSVYLKLFSPGIIYINMGDLLGALNFGALVFCLFLYFKGRFFPSSSDNSTTGNFIFDYYWGTELFPQIAGINVKQFTNCRFGMTGWALAVVSFAFAQKEIYGTADLGIIVSASLIFIYLFKFFIWESGYMKSMDIQVDRAGFMICWGCLVWVPAVYTSPVMYMVKHPAGLSYAVAGLIFVLGFISIWLNYWADQQRQSVRSTNGDTTIWGAIPVLIHAPYTTEDGSKKTNILLASGFWGVSRHFHYVPEILAAFFWSCAAGTGAFLPYFYVIFLVVLLTHRAFRDDTKCRNKYGKSWDQYCELVPYKIIPWVI
jgi:7-dehydrocholesterol reductase